MSGQSKIHIGTSGWHYAHWTGPFYPEGTTGGKMLPYYTRFFQTVEINNSFYRLPEKKTFEQWRETAPADFLFAVKASRFITHIKRLKDPEKSLGAFMERVVALQDKLGPILFQLPPRWHINPERLNSFLAALPPGYRFAFEFRDPSWFQAETYAALSRHQAAFCIFELAGRQSPREVTSDFVYVRLHGPGDAYQGSYSLDTLGNWARTFSGWADEGKEVYCYFDNDQMGYAVENARQLKRLLQ